MSNFLTTPWDLANSFLSRFDEFRSGKLAGPVLTPEMSMGIMNSIRKDPVAMVNFFVQTNYLIKHGLDEKFGKDSETSILGIMEWSNLTYGMFIPSLSLMLQANAELLEKRLPELIPEEYPLDVPAVDPSEVFKNIEGLNMDWITPEPSADRTDPEQEPPQT